MVTFSDFDNGFTYSDICVEVISCNINIHIEILLFDFVFGNILTVLVPRHGNIAYWHFCLLVPKHELLYCHMRRI